MHHETGEAGAAGRGTARGASGGRGNSPAGGGGRGRGRGGPKVYTAPSIESLEDTFGSSRDHLRAWAQWIHSSSGSMADLVATFQRDTMPTDENQRTRRVPKGAPLLLKPVEDSLLQEASAPNRS